MAEVLLVDIVQDSIHVLELTEDDGGCEGPEGGVELVVRLADLVLESLIRYEGLRTRQDGGVGGR